MKKINVGKLDRHNPLISSHINTLILQYCTKGYPTPVYVSVLQELKSVTWQILHSADNV